MVHTIQNIAAGLAFLCVVLEARNHTWNFPISILSCFFYGYVFYHKGIYGDMYLQLVFIIGSCIGWYNWTYHKTTKRSLPITQLTALGKIAYIGVALLLSLVIYYCLDHFTSSTVPLWDGITTGISLTALWLIIQRKIEHWFFWIFADCIYIYLYSLKNVGDSTTILYIIYLPLSVYGFLIWKQKLKSSTSSV